MVIIMKKYIMALDQGTTSSRCILFNHAGEIVSQAQREFTQIYPMAGWVEHDPHEIWSSQLSVITEALGRVGAFASEVEAIGITNQRETTIMWDRTTGEPVYNAIVWQCRRTAGIIDDIVKRGYDTNICEKTGLIPDAYFSASKVKWILDNVEGIREKANRGDIMFGTVDTWLIYKLTRGKSHVTDYTNASRTMMFDIHKLEWSKEILEMFDIPTSILPKVQPSSSAFGMADGSLLGAEIPICGVAGDQQAALFGQCCFDAGEAKNTYGTGCFLLMNTGDKPISSKHGLLTTIAASTQSTVQYALEGSVFVAGAAIQWLRDELKIIECASDTEAMANSVSDSNGVYVVPAFTGLGAPYWDQYARGAMFGLTRGTKREHIVRATLESLAYQTRDVIKAMELDSSIMLRTLQVDGGASANGFLMQFQSDILNCKVCRPKVIETTALGAAYLAGLYSGYWTGKEEIKENKQKNDVFKPDMNKKEIEIRIENWYNVIKAVRQIIIK